MRGRSITFPPPDLALFSLQAPLGTRTLLEHLCMGTVAQAEARGSVLLECLTTKGGRADVRVASYVSRGAWLAASRVHGQTTLLHRARKSCTCDRYRSQYICPPWRITYDTYYSVAYYPRLVCSQPMVNAKPHCATPCQLRPTARRDCGPGRSCMYLPL